MAEENGKFVIRNVNDAYTFVGGCMPFKIRKAVLTQPMLEEKEVYLIALRGTNRSFNRKDPLGLPVCVRSSCGIHNIYFNMVKAAMLEQIPQDSAVVFIAHSLGGMVSQQLAADKQLQRCYHILNNMTMGSPYVLFKGSKGPIRRMREGADVIPLTCSPAGITNLFFGNITCECAGYVGNPLGAHCDSYEKGEVWRKYDCFGIKNGGRVITFDIIDD